MNQQQRQEVQAEREKFLEEARRVLAEFGVRTTMDEDYDAKEQGCVYRTRVTRIMIMKEYWKEVIQATRRGGGDICHQRILVCGIY